MRAEAHDQNCSLKLPSRSLESLPSFLSFYLFRLSEVLGEVLKCTKTRIWAFLVFSLNLTTRKGYNVAKSRSWCGLDLLVSVSLECYSFFSGSLGFEVICLPSKSSKWAAGHSCRVFWILPEQYLLGFKPDSVFAEFWREPRCSVNKTWFDVVRLCGFKSYLAENWSACLHLSWFSFLVLMLLNWSWTQRKDFPSNLYCIPFLFQQLAFVSESVQWPILLHNQNEIFMIAFKFFVCHLCIVFLFAFDYCSSKSTARELCNTKYFYLFHLSHFARLASFLFTVMIQLYVMLWPPSKQKVIVCKFE